MSNGELKQRFSVQASSLGNYFGVGFKTIDEQLDIDLGLIPNEFDDDAKERMLLGATLEDSVLNFFEQKLAITITERNTKVLEMWDGMLRLKLDGVTMYEGVPTVVECKVSNSTSGCFTKDKGYMLQCQAYMACKDFTQCLLLGLYQGKPVVRLIKRDQEIIDDIKAVVESVVGILSGLYGKDSYPTDIINKYSNQLEELPALEDVPQEIVDAFNELYKVNKARKDYEKMEKELQQVIKNSYSTGKFEGDTYKVSMSTSAGRKTLDLDRLSVEHPEIDVDSYYKEGTPSTTIRFTAKKA